MPTRNPIGWLIETRTLHLEISVGLLNKTNCANSVESRDRTAFAMSGAQIVKFLTSFTVNRRVWKAFHSHTAGAGPVNIACVMNTLIPLLDQFILAKSRNEVASM